MRNQSAIRRLSPEEMIQRVIALRRDAAMEASAWILLISIPVLLVALFFHRRQAQFRGLGLFGASCPQCAAPLPTVRKATSIREALWGGWTCENCGCKVDRRGRERDW